MASRTSFLVTGALAAGLSVAGLRLAIAAPNDPRLSLSEIAGIEATVHMPKGAGQLKSYDRFCSTFTASATKGGPDFLTSRLVGHHVAIGHWIGRPDTGRGRVHIVPMKDLPGVMDGGCGIINVTYDLTERRLLQVWCNGLA